MRTHEGGKLVTEDSSMALLTREGVYAELMFEQNKDKLFMKNTTVYAQMWDHDYCRRDEASTSEVWARLPYLAFVNEMQTIIQRVPLRYTFNFDAHYKRVPHSSRVVSPPLGLMTGSNDAEQTTGNQIVKVAGQGKMSLPLDDFTLTARVGGLYLYRDDWSDLNLFMLDSTNLHNRLFTHGATLDAGAEIAYSNAGFECELSIPISWDYNWLRAPHLDRDTVTMSWPFSLRLFLGYEVLPGLNFKIHADYFKERGGMGALAPYYELYAARDLRLQRPFAQSQEHVDYRVRAEYRNVMVGLLAHASFAHEFDWVTPQEILAPTSEGLFTYHFVDTSSFSRGWTSSASLSWLIVKLQITLALEGYYGQQRADFLQGLDMPGQWFSRSWGVSPSVQVSSWRYLNFTVAYSYGASSSTSYSTVNTSLRTTMNITPSSEHVITMKHEWNTSIKDAQWLYDGHFLDCTYSYRPRKLRMSFALEGRNLLNNKWYTETFDSAQRAYIKRIMLRPLCVLLTVKWSLS